jgi:uncharacterized protein (DUF1684 family)
MTVSSPLTTYESEILEWRKQMDDDLRSDNGWLTLAGLHWLNEGENTLGSSDASDIPLPSAAPEHLGTIQFHNDEALLQVNDSMLINGEPTQTTLLLSDWDDNGPTVVEVGAISFFVIKRGDQYGVRVRDRNSSVRQTFAGRQWFAVDPSYRVTAAFTPHPAPRAIEVMNTLGILVQMGNPGYVEFELNGQRLTLEAFDANDNQLWFIFRDATSGRQTYGAGRFLYAPRHADDTVTLDFNRAYSPPCAFTPYATCPLPPKDNILSIAIEAGEKD